MTGQPTEYRGYQLYTDNSGQVHIWSKPHSFLYVATELGVQPDMPAAKQFIDAILDN